MSEASQHEQLAAALANQADQVASKLKAGTWDSVQALAALSIAHSLLGAAARTPGDGRPSGA